MGRVRSISKYPAPIAAVLFVAVFTAMVLVIYYRLPVGMDWEPGVFSIGVDWKGTYKPSALAILRGENPYRFGLQNPPWILLPLLPVALLPKELGAAVMFTAGFFVYGFVAYRMGFRWWAILAFLFNSMTMSCFVNGNTDWLVMLGLLFPPWIGLFFLVLKPQLSIGILIYLLLDSWRAGGWRKVLRDFSPVSAVLLASFLPWGFWPGQLYQARLADGSNASLFPLLLPVGLVWLLQAVRKRDIKPAIMSSVFLTPYITYHGYAVAFLGLDSYAVLIAAFAVWVMPFL